MKSTIQLPPTYPRVSKEIMSKSLVPVVPGYFGEDQSDQRLSAEANSMGYVGMKYMYVHCITYVILARAVVALLLILASD